MLHERGPHTVLITSLSLARQVSHKSHTSLTQVSHKSLKSLKPHTDPFCPFVHPPIFPPLTTAPCPPLPEFHEQAAAYGLIDRVIQRTPPADI